MTPTEDFSAADFIRYDLLSVLFFIILEHSGSSFAAGFAERSEKMLENVESVSMIVERTDT